MIKKYKVYKSGGQPCYSCGGAIHSEGGLIYKDGGIFTQDSGTQDFRNKMLDKFVNKLHSNIQNFQTDEGLADAIAIQESINKEMPEFKSGGNWMQEARKEMKRKGTVGKFTDYCGGKVTNDCIERGLNSPDETVRKRAQFAKAARSVARNKSAFGGFIPMEDSELPTAQIGRQPGTTTMTVTKEDPNAEAWRQYYEGLGKKGQKQLRKGMNNLLYGATQLYSQPTRYEYEGDPVDLLSNYPDADFTSMEVTGYTPGVTNVNEGKQNIFGKDKKAKYKAGKTATLHMRAKGTRPVQDPGSLDWDIDDTTDTTTDIGDYANIPEIQSDKTALEEDLNKRREDVNLPPRENEINLYNTSGPRANKEVIEDEDSGNFFDDSQLGYRDGGGFKKYRIYKAQDGVSYPDNGIAVDAEGNPLVPVEGLEPDMSAYTWDLFGNQNNITAPETEFQYNFEGDPVTDRPPEVTLGDEEVTQDTDIELKKVGKVKSLMEKNPYAIPNAILGAFDTIIGIDNTVQSRKGEEKLRKRNDPLRRYDVRTKRHGLAGDYTAHTTQKIGPNLTPDRYTRMGYGTKMAQQGFEVDDVLDISPEQIRELIAQGYEFEFID